MNNIRFLLALLPTASLAACQATTPAPVVAMRAEPPTTVFYGEGRLSAEAEFVEVTVRIVAECHPTVAAASAAGDRATAAVMRVLEAALEPGSKRDGVFSSGGFSRPFTSYDRSRRRCGGTYQKTNTVVMKSSRVKQFPTEFARIQTAILGGALRQPGANDASGAVTYATIDAPVVQLTHETRERLEQKALGLALENAQAKLSATAAAACSRGRHRVVKFIEPGVESGRPIAYNRSQAGRNAKSAVAFDAIWINKLLEVHFELDSARC